MDRSLAPVALGGISGLLWVLAPKCPACWAAYSALFSGLGVTVSESGYRGLLAAAFAASAAAYVFIAWRRGRMRRVPAVLGASGLFVTLVSAGAGRLACLLCLGLLLLAMFRFPACRSGTA